MEICCEWHLGERYIRDCHCHESIHCRQMYHSLWGSKYGSMLAACILYMNMARCCGCSFTVWSRDVKCQWRVLIQCWLMFYSVYTVWANSQQIMACWPAYIHVQINQRWHIYGRRLKLEIFWGIQRSYPWDIMSDNHEIGLHIAYGNIWTHE